MTFYVTIAERLDRGHTYANATIKERKTTCVASDNAPERGPLGTYSEGGKTISYTAIGAYKTVPDARKAARAAIRDRGFRPGLMRDADEYGFSNEEHYTIEGRP